MPHLNWRDKPLKPQPTPHATFQTQLELALSEELVVELQAELLKALAPGGPELRLDLPAGWTIYWKLREQGLSRLQLAKPQAGQWVATVQLTAEVAQVLLFRIGELRTQGPVSVCALGTTTGIVNFELVLKAF